MAIGWLSVLKMVPWGDVIENAPKVAQGAKKFLSAVGKKAVPGVSDTLYPATPTQAAGEQDTVVAALQKQVAELQAATTELHLQMLQSSALIQSLAEQNTQLVQRVELIRKRVLLLAVVTLMLAAALLVLHI